MTRETLLQELETLTHDGRTRRMVELGRAAREQPELARLLEALDAGGFYERRLALAASFGSGDAARVERALTDPSRGIRGLAMALLPLVGSDAQVLSAFDVLPRRSWRPLLWRLLRRRRRPPIDALLERLAADADEWLVRCLPFGSDAAVRRHVDRFAERAGRGDWVRLAMLHPEVAADGLQRLAREPSGRDTRLLQAVSAALPELADRVPDAAVELVRRMLPHVPLAMLPLQRLALRASASVADLLLESGDSASAAGVLERVAHRLDPARRAALLARPDAPLGRPQTWLRRLRPEDRTAVYAVSGAGWRSGEGLIAPELLRDLPREAREAEARRHLRLPVLAARTEQRLTYAALAAWDESTAALAPALRDPNAERRAAAWSARVGALRYHRDRTLEVLEQLRARRNEQDPVRGAWLAALADLPPGLWGEEHLQLLGELIQDALNAADLSPRSAASMERLLVRLMPFHPDWAASGLSAVVRHRGTLATPALDRLLSDRDVARLGPHLLPVLEAWRTREREAKLITALRAFGLRLRGFEAGAALLEGLAREAHTHSVAAAALGLLWQHRREQLQRLVPELLAVDGSWAINFVVYEYLHRYRQDLLTPYLGQEPWKGRFSSGRTRFVLPIRSGFHRWTPAQQRLFATTLAEVIEDPPQGWPTLYFTTSQLGAMTDVPPDRLVERARWKPGALRDAALGALGGMDAGQGIPELLEALNDERARVAIYALRHALLEMPASAALALLRGVPLDRVTVAKEVIRLYGELPGEEAFQELLAADARDLHRDVRTALLRALWAHLERDESWPILERAAASPDPALAAMVGRTLAERLSPRAQDRLARLVAVVLRHPDPRVRLDAIVRCVELPVRDAGAVLLEPLLEALETGLPDPVRQAGTALVTLYGSGDSQRIGEAVGRLLPHRRGLERVVLVLVGELRRSRRALLPVARAALSALEADPLTAALRVRIAAVALPWEELAEYLEALCAREELHTEALMAAVDALYAARTRPDSEGVESLEQRLGPSDDPRLRRLALAALQASAASPREWDAARLDRLRAYRQDPAPLVAAAAQFVFPAAELEEQCG